MMYAHEDCRPDDWVQTTEPITPTDIDAFTSFDGTPLPNTEPSSILCSAGGPHCYFYMTAWQQDDESGRIYADGMICQECGDSAPSTYDTRHADWEAEMDAWAAAEEAYVRWLEDAGSRWDPEGYEHDRRLW